MNMVKGLNDFPEPENDQPTLERIIMPTKPRDINIVSSNYGFHVNVGCQSFAIENVDTLLNMLGQYLTNPSETEDKWMNKQLEIK